MLDGHLELASDIQMNTKDYAGVYTRHLHMEPIGTACGRSPYSELWINKPVLDVITSSTFGGFGTIYSDVFLETRGRLAPGYASLGTKGNCYEQRAGTLKMKNLRMDAGAELHFSIGHNEGLNGEKTDVIEVDHLRARGTIEIYIEKRCGETYRPGCYPLILYNSVDPSNLNNLKLATTRIDGTLLSLDFSMPGVVNLCVGAVPTPVIQREVIIPTPPPGVVINPPPGSHWVPWGHHFDFTVTHPLKDMIYVIMSDRDLGNNEQEILTGKLNDNGEWEYRLPFVKNQPVRIFIGPNTIAVPNEAINNKAAVWSSGNTLYIRVANEDIVSIYSISGSLVNRITVPEGGTTLPLARGAYIVTLKDGSVHKVIIM